MATLEHWTATDLRRRLEEGETPTLLDVREPRERDWCALPSPRGGADLHVPMNQVPAHLKAIEIAVPAGAALVVYCHHGVRSLAVAEWLARQGIARVVNLEGGIDDWSLRVDPSVRRY